MEVEVYIVGATLLGSLGGPQPTSSPCPGATPTFPAAALTGHGLGAPCGPHQFTPAAVSSWPPCHCPPPPLLLDSGPRDYAHGVHKLWEMAHTLHQL
jgi:hypothetical protein